MRVMTVSVIVFLFCQLHIVHAQRREVRGVVVDSASGSALYGATVVISRVGDSTANGAVVDRRGRFVVRGASDGANLLRVSYVGYKPHVDTIDISMIGGAIDTVRLVQGAILGASIVVTQSRLRTLQKGDTTEYSASAFNIDANADADKLIKQLPGVSMKDGKVRANGEVVDKVLVDGLEFFGDDVMSTLSNLPADIIDKVQIYDTKSETAKQSGQDEKSTTKTINIVTMEDKRKGTFGKGAAGYGLQNRYEANGTFNQFDSTFRFSVLAMANNVNEAGFNVNDVMDANGTSTLYQSSSGFYVMTSDGTLDDALIGRPSSGITSTRSAMVTGSNTTGPVKFNATYTIADRTTDVETSMLRQFVTPSMEGQRYEQSNTSVSGGTDHRIRAGFKAELDTATQLSLASRLSLRGTTLDDQFIGSTQDANQTISGTSSKTIAESSTLSFSNDLRFSHRFAKPQRYLSIDLGLSSSSSDSRRDLSARNTAAVPSESDTIDQRAAQDGLRHSVVPTLSYTEPLTDNTYMKMKLRAERSSSLSNRRTRIDPAGGGLYSDIDTALSNSFEQTFSQYGGEATLGLKDSLIKASVSCEYLVSDLSGVTTFPLTSTTSRSFVNLLPSASFDLVGMENFYGSVSYRAKTRLPTIEQMQGVLDNSNPLILSIGTPSLRQAIEHEVALDAQGSITSIDAYYFGYGSLSYISDVIGTSTLIADRDTVVDGIQLLQGRQLTRPVNLQGGVSAYASGYFGMQIDTLPLRLNLNTTVMYDVAPGLINGLLNEARSSRYTIGLDMSYYIEGSINLSAGVEYSAGSVENSIAQGINNTYSIVGMNAQATWTLSKGLDLEAAFSNRANGGLSSGFNQNISLLNVSLSKSLFESERGTIQLSIRDALNQNADVQRTFNNAFTQDMRSMLLRRVVLLTFRYRFRQFGE
jgi:hypothetical protein